MDKEEDEEYKETIHVYAVCVMWVKCMLVCTYVCVEQMPRSSASLFLSRDQIAAPRFYARFTPFHPSARGEAREPEAREE